jgi:hypothetical protein
VLSERIRRTSCDFGSGSPAALKDYQDSVKAGASFMSSGQYYSAIEQYEHAAAVADQNKLKVDRAYLNAKLAAARKALDDASK